MLVLMLGQSGTQEEQTPSEPQPHRWSLFSHQSSAQPGSWLPGLTRLRYSRWPFELEEMPGVLWDGVLGMGGW